MKKNLLLLSMLVFAVSPAFAGVDIKTSTEPSYMRNSNYSEETIRLVQLTKAYANGESLPAQQEESHKVIHAIYKYLDPGWDDNKFFVRDIPQQPGFGDL